MNLPSLQTLLNQCLSKMGMLCLLFLLGMQSSTTAQSIIQKDTINVVIPTNDNKGVVTGQQLHDELNPSGLLFFDNIDSIDVNGRIFRDTNFIPNDNTPILYLGCDTISQYEGTILNPVSGDSAFYGIDRRLDTLANFTKVTFFSYFDGVTNSNNTTIRPGSNMRANNPVLSGTGVSIGSVFKVIDNSPPIAICKAGTMTSPLVVQLDSLGMITASQLDSISEDNCTRSDLLSFSISPDTIQCDSLMRGAFMVTLTVADEFGNSSTCTSAVSVEDNVGPIIQNVPADDTITCGDAIPLQATLTALDNCSSVPMDSIRMFADTLRPDTSTALMVSLDSLARDSAWYNYDIIYKWVATDTSSNVGDTAYQVIRVRDTLAPAIAFNTLILVPTNPTAATCSADVTLDLAANVTDGCSDSLKYLAIADSNMVVIHDTLDVVTFNVPQGDTTVFIIAEDWSNNRDTHRIDIQVDDRTTPTPRCNNAVSITINAFGFAAIDSSVINLNSVDNCTDPLDLTFSLSRDTFRCEDIGQAINVFMTVNDEAGNSAFCRSTVTVLDFAGSGSFACPADVTIDCNQYEKDVVNTILTGEPSLMDVCGDNSTLTFSDTTVAGPGGATNVCQIVERTWIVTDTSGTVTTCMQLINLLDDEAPVLTATYSDTIVNCILDAVTADSILVTDNCMDDVYVQAVDSFTMGTDTILLRRIWTASDFCRTTADTQYVKLVDDIAPAIVFPSDTFVYNTGMLIPDSCGAFVNIDFTQFITDCNASLGLKIRHSLKDTTVLSQYFPVGEHTVMVTARDSSGNIATKNILIDVNDTSTPTLVCVENLVISLGTGGTGNLQIANVINLNTGVSDNCGGMIDTTFLSQRIFDCTDLGMNQVILTAVDSAGNAGTCTINVEVVNQGNSSIIVVDTDAQDESFVGENDGIAWVDVTGGSGNYDYLWSPGGATTDTIKNLAPGLYTVAVNDMNSGCRLTDTVRVNSGGTVVYTLGQAFGNAGDTVQVPVTVTNFNSIAGFEMRFTLSNTDVAEFVDENEAGGYNFPGLNNSSFQYQSAGVLDVTSFISQGSTLSDGTTIFFLNVVLKGTAGQTVDLNMMPLEVGATAIESTVIRNGMATIIDSEGNAVTLTIGDAPSTVAFAGNIHLENDVPVDSVVVTLSGAATGIDSTDVMGDYGFNVTPSQSLTVTPSSDRTHNRGLSVTDLAIIHNHVLGNALLDSPYKMIAADVNGNERITVTDLAEIQAIVLGVRTEFFTAPSWKFIPEDFPITLANPWANPIPSSISTVSDNADFIAVKMGDANLSATSGFHTENSATSREAFRFVVEDRLLKEGEVIEIPFKADNFSDMYAYQMTINANAAYLTFETVTAGALADIDKRNFGLTNATRGLISTLWYSPEPLSIEQNATLFTISFRVNKGGKYLSDILRTSSDMLYAEAHAEGKAAKNISLTFDNNKTIEGFELFQNKPNPFNAETIISFSLPKANSATLRFFDFSGRLVHQVKGAYKAGVNNVVVHKNELSGSGVLYYELAAPTFTARKKMIVLD